MENSGNKTMVYACTGNANTSSMVEMRDKMRRGGYISFKNENKNSISENIWFLKYHTAKKHNDL